MPPDASQQLVRSAVPDDGRDVSRFPTCPMCHTPMPLAQSAIDAGAGWTCGRCGQHWDVQRLSAVAAYAAWVVERFPGRPTGGPDEMSQRGDPSGGHPVGHGAP